VEIKSGLAPTDVLRRLCTGLAVTPGGGDRTLKTQQ
jgi:hypothetical protein